MRLGFFILYSLKKINKYLETGSKKRTVVVRGNLTKGFVIRTFPLSGVTKLQISLIISCETGDY